MRYRAVVAAVVLVVGSAACALAQSPKTPDKQPGADKGQTNVLGTDKSPAVVRLLPIPETKEQTARQEAERQQTATYNDRTLVVNGLLAAITFGLFILGIYQYQITKAQLATTHALERSYLSGLISVETLQHTRDTPRLRVEIRNSGRSKGRIMAVHFLGTISDEADLPETPVYEPSDGVITLLKRDGIDMPVYDAIRFRFRYNRAGGFTGFRNGSDAKTLIVYGWVRYKDIFGETHTTRIAGAYTPEVSEFRGLENSNYEEAD